MTTFQANLLCKPLLFIPSSSLRLSPSRSLSTFTPVSLSSPKPPITLCSLNPNHNNAYFTSDSTAEKKRLLADADGHEIGVEELEGMKLELKKLMDTLNRLIKLRTGQDWVDLAKKGLLDVDPKASKKSTTIEKLKVFMIKKKRLEELFPNPEFTKNKAYEEVVEFIKTPEFDAKQAFEEVGEFLQNPKVKQVTEEVVELIKNPKFDAKQVMEVVGEFLNNPKAKKKVEEVVEFIKKPEFDAKQAFEAVGEFLKNPEAKQEFEEFIKYPNFDAKQAFEVVDGFLKNPKSKQMLEEVVEFIKNPNFESKLAFEMMEILFLQDPKGEEGQLEKVVEMIKNDPKLDVEEAFEALGEFFNDPKSKQEFEEGVEFIKNPQKLTGLGGNLRVAFFLLRLRSRKVYKRAYKAVFSVFSKLKYY